MFKVTDFFTFIANHLSFVYLCNLWLLILNFGNISLAMPERVEFFFGLLIMNWKLKSQFCGPSSEALWTHRSLLRKLLKDHISVGVTTWYFFLLDSCHEMVCHLCQHPSMLATLALHLRGRVYLPVEFSVACLSERGSLGIPGLRVLLLPTCTLRTSYPKSFVTCIISPVPTLNTQVHVKWKWEKNTNGRGGIMGIKFVPLNYFLFSFPYLF